MNMKYTEVPTYETVDICGKTMDTITGTIDRKLIKRALLTTQAGFDGKHMVVNGDETVIRTVQKIGEDEGDAKAVELFVRLVGDIRSLASYKFFEGYVGDNAENTGAKDLYTTDAKQIDNLAHTARRMCESHPECDSQWEIVDAAGTRWFIRKIVTNLTSNGMLDN